MKPICRIDWIEMSAVLWNPNWLKLYSCSTDPVREVSNSSRTLVNQNHMISFYLSSVSGVDRNWLEFYHASFFRCFFLSRIPTYTHGVLERLSKNFLNFKRGNRARHGSCPSCQRNFRVEIDSTLFIIWFPIFR